MKRTPLNVLNILFLFTFFLSLSMDALEETITDLPGRLNNQNLHVAKIGNCDLFFYMTPEKFTIAKELIKEVNEEIVLTFGQAALPCPTIELLVQAIKHPEKDPHGTALLDAYAYRVKDIAEKTLGISILGFSRYMNLNLNWEALKLHQDRFYEQYAYLNKQALPPSKYTLVQDLTLIDWQMAKSTLSATMVQDGRLGDRFLIALFPGEIVGTFYTEPAIGIANCDVAQYPGHITMPPHSTVPPMDRDGIYTSGSSKGKRMSTAVRGVVLTEEIDNLKSACIPLTVNRKHPEIFNDSLSWVYENGIVVKTLPEKVTAINLAQTSKLCDRENVDIAEISSQNNKFIIQQLATLFNLPFSSTDEVKILRLTKKDGGFSHIKLMDLPITENSHIVVMNHSKHPQGYRYFNLAEDCTKNGLPWIQLYRFDPSTALKIPTNEFNKLSLTAVEELLHRDEYVDSLNSEYSSLMEKLVTQLDVFIFPPAKI